MKYQKVDENVINAVIEAAEESIQRRQICSPLMFFDPKDYNAIVEAFKDIVDCEVRCFGGFEQAEKRRALFSHIDPYLLEVRVES